MSTTAENIWSYAPSQGVSYESYHRSPEELDTLEAQAVSVAAALYGRQEGVVALAMRGENLLADFGRTLETDTFAHEDYDFHTGMAPYEDHSVFLYTIDLDEGRIAHTKRIVEPQTPLERLKSGLTGIEMIDDRLRAEKPEERATVEEILAHHGVETVDGSLNIATNIDTGRATQTLSKPFTLMSYKAVFELAKQSQVTQLFAYMNQLAVRSLAKLGVEDELLGGKEYHLPLVGSRTEFDDDYVAVVFPDNAANNAAFNQFNPQKPLTKLIADKDVPLLFAE